MIKNKEILKKIIVLILTLLIAFFVGNRTASAKTTYSDSNEASFTGKNITKSFETDYTEYKTEEGVTTYKQNTYNQRVHVFFQKQTSNSKIVSWAVQSDAGKFARCNVAAIAQNYETMHPGWKVVGAINADQYTTGFGTNIGASGKDYYYPQPYYSMICDGEGWFVMTGLPSGGSQNILGFIQGDENRLLINGSSNLRVGDLKFSGIYLYILDDNDNRIEKFQVHKINETPRELETAVWSGHVNSKEEFNDITIRSNEISKNIYVIKRADKAIANNSIDFTYKGDDGRDAFFGKGRISEVTDVATFGYGAFAIETKDEYLQEKLGKGVKVMVQYELEGDFSKVESAIGYHTIHRKNDKDIPTNASYNTNKYTRSIVGKTKDGRLFLMAVDQTSYSGMNAEEINATLKYYGVDEAYQMDGGGSTTAVIKENGKFLVVNSPRDGSPRNVFSALLFVEKENSESNNINTINVFLPKKKENIINRIRYKKEMAEVDNE